MGPQSITVSVGFKDDPGDIDLSRLDARLYLVREAGDRTVFGKSRLNQKGNAEFIGLPKTTDTVAVEVSDPAGRVLFGPEERAVADELLKVELDESTKKAIPKEVSPTRELITRHGHFRVLGNAGYSFAGFRLHVAPAAEAVAKRIGEQYDDPIPNGGGWVVVNPAKLPSNRLHIAAGKIRFDGAFRFHFDNADGAGGWLYLLAGRNESFLGYVPDLFEKPKSAGHVVLLPVERGPDKPLPAARLDEAETSPDCQGAKAHSIPFDVEESQLLEYPEAFAEDPGQFCKPFQNPERILGERRFETVLRSEQPDIFASTEAAFEPLPENIVWHSLYGQKQDRKVFVDLQNQRLKQARLLERNRRRPAGAGNLLDWEDDVLTHQAISVAGGHVLEWSVRWRSSGYSLGTINHSTNLLARQRKRIMKIDFARRELARREEITAVDDEVEQGAEASRDYLDAVKADLSEWAAGSSQSAAAGAAVGGGALLGKAIVGGGAAGGAAASASQQQGGRAVAASEEQRLRDALRQYGESLRELNSTVITESIQNETVEGTSEVLWNPNYCHSVTVVHYEILRHLRVDTELAGVSECLYVPFPISPFSRVDANDFPSGYDVRRVIRHRDAIARHLLDGRLRWVLPHLEDYAAGFLGSSIPEGRRMDQDVVTLRGSIDVKLEIACPLQGDEDARALEEAADPQANDRENLGHAMVVGGLIATAFGPYTALLGVSVAAAGATLAAVAAQERERLFNDEIAPTMARRFLESLKLEVNNQRLDADFTFSGAYRKGGVHRVHFQVSRSALEKAGITRADLEEVLIAPHKDRLPPHHSQAVVTGARLQVSTPTYRKILTDTGVRDDLIHLPAVPSDPHAAHDTARLNFPASAWEKENLRRSIQRDVEKLVRHLDANVFHYHKAIWSNMDPDEIFTILDGYTVSSTDQRSLASVLEYRPLAIVGNSLVFRVARGAFVGVGGFASLNEARGFFEPVQRVSDPIRVSLPTGGLYSQTLMDPCNACEEHFGSTDWVLNEEELAPQELDSSLLGSRRQAPAGLAPSQFPGSLINLVNTPAPPPPSGVDDILDAAGTSSFRDMAGLAGTQANARAAMEAATRLATHFGGLAAKKLDAERAAVSRVNDDDSLSNDDKQALKESLKQQQQAGTTDAPDPRELLSDVANAAPPHMSVLHEQNGKGSKTTIEKKPTADVTPGKMIIGEPALQGTDSGGINLDFHLGNILSSSPQPAGRSCVEMSLFYFHAACKQLDCASRRTARANGRDILVPLIRRPDGLVNPQTFHRIWFTVQKPSSKWQTIPAAVRGAGAPGALHYAGLADGPLITSNSGWPAGMRIGAFLQLWRDEATYQQAVAGTLTSSDDRPTGHSCIFIAYDEDDPTRILVADQNGMGYGLSYGWLDFRYVIAANLRQVELADAESLGASDLGTGDVEEEPVPQTIGQVEPEEVARFPDASTLMAQLMSEPKEAQFGQRTIRTGDVYAGFLVVEPDATNVTYWDENRATLDRVNYAEFFRRVNLTALSQGASRAAWLDDLARAEFEFMVAVLFGFRATAAIGLLRVLTAMNQHRDASLTVIRNLDLVYEALRWLVKHHPRLALCILKQSVVEVVTSVPGSLDRLTVPQLANLFGKMVRGTGVAALSGNFLRSIALATAGTLSGFTALKVLPAASAEAVENKANEIRTELATHNIDVDLTCLKEGLRDLLSEQDAQQVEDVLKTLAEKTIELSNAIEQILPDL